MGAWTTNNCSTFTLGLMRELGAAPAPGFDPWPTWSYCLATPPVQMPKSRPPPPVAADVSPEAPAITDDDPTRTVSHCSGEGPPLAIRSTSYVSQRSRVNTEASTVI